MHDTRTSSAASPSRCWLVWLALAFVAALLLRTLSASGWWIHLAAGRYIVEHGLPATDPFSFTTDAGRPWINSAWLYDTLMYGLWNVGQASAIVLAHAAAVLLAFALLAVPLARQHGAAASASAVLLCGWTMAPLCGAAPATLAVLFPALFMRLLSAPTRVWPALALVVLQVLWTNLHQSFLVGPLMVAAFAVERTVRPSSESGAAASQPRRALALWAAVLLATFVNPYAFRLHVDVLSMWFDPERNLMLEWVSPFSGQFSFALGRYAITALLVVAVSGFVLVKQKLPLAITCCAVASAFLLVRSPHFVDICSILMLPFAALSLAAIAESAAGRLGAASRPRLRWAGPAVVAAAALASIYVAVSNRYLVASGSASRFGLGKQDELLPGGAVEALLRRADFPGRALNLAADGGYLAWLLPDRKIFTDTRASLYGSPFYNTMTRALAGDTGPWQELAERWNIEAVILNCAWPGAGSACRFLLSQRPWALLYFDGTTALLVKASEGTRNLLAQTAAGPAGLATLEETRIAYRDALARHPVQPNSPRLIGGASVLLSLGRLRAAESLYSLLARGAPGLAVARLNLAVCQIEQGRAAEAIVALEEFVRARPDHVLGWLWLSKAYRGANREDDGSKAYARAAQLDRPLSEAFFATNTPPAKR